jgi:hypothetical protein
VDLVALTEDVRSHLRVPETGLVAEVNTGFKHLTHGYRHLLTPILRFDRRPTCQIRTRKSGYALNPRTGVSQDPNGPDV